MIRPGMVSVTFRDLSVEDIIALAAEAKLEAIEWGGDVHVPPGNVELAQKVRQMTESAGLRVSSYGSYYRLGSEEASFPEFDKVVATAAALGAPTIRVWAGTRGSADADADYRARLVDAARGIADIASAAPAVVACEFHADTLTDTAGSARDFYEAIDHPNVSAYWQLDESLSPEARFRSLELVSPWLSNLHVFHYDGGKQVALARGGKAWRRYFALADTVGGDHYALLEFVEDGEPKNLLRDGATLRMLLS